VKSIRNPGQSLLREEPDLSRLSSIDAFNHNVEITVDGLDYSDQLFVRLEWITTGTLGFITNLVDPSRETAIYDGGKLARQNAGISTA